jgi:hypothetical protein
LGIEAHRHVEFVSVEFAAPVKTVTKGACGAAAVERESEGSSYWCELPPKTGKTWQVTGR